MKIYLVSGLYMGDGEDFSTEAASYCYGIFSSKEKAEEICADIKTNMSEHNENNEVVSVNKFELDRPTEWYDFMMNN